MKPGLTCVKCEAIFRCSADKKKQTNKPKTDPPDEQEQAYISGLNCSAEILCLRYYKISYI